MVSGAAAHRAEPGNPLAAANHKEEKWKDGPQ